MVVARAPARNVRAGFSGAVSSWAKSSIASDTDVFVAESPPRTPHSAVFLLLRAHFADTLGLVTPSGVIHRMAEPMTWTPTLFPLVAAMAISCAPCPRSAAPPGPAPSRDAAMLPAEVPDEAAVAAVLDDWHDAAARADETRYFDHFTADAVFLGTDATERWSVEAFRKYAHPHFAKGKAWSFRAARRTIAFSARGDLAWFDEDLETPNLGPARGSGVLRRGDDGRWRIAHYNLTITVPNEKMDAVKTLLEAPTAPSAAAPIADDPIKGRR